MAFHKFPVPRTPAVDRALRQVTDSSMVADLLFWEKWEFGASRNFSDYFRVLQLRRANPDLASELRAGIE